MLMGKLTAYLGHQIKTLRKMKGISVERLSQLIKKSPATIYKYESGQIALDIDSIAEIADALDIDLIHFLSFAPKNKTTAFTKHSFFSFNKLYAYFYDGRTKRLTKSILVFSPNNTANEPYKAILYFDVYNFETPEIARYIYSGTLTCLETVSYFILKNVSFDVETFVIEMLNPMGTSNYTWGLFLGLSEYPLSPMATKLLIAKTPLQQEDLDKMSLKFTKEELRIIKEKNAIFLNLLSPREHS